MSNPASCGLSVFEINRLTRTVSSTVFCEYRPKRPKTANTATKFGTIKLEENDVIVFQIYLGQFNRSADIFEGIFEKLEKINDTKMHLSHENWTLIDHQPKVRDDYEDVARPKSTRY